MLLSLILLTGVAVVEFGLHRTRTAPHVILIVLDTVRADHVSASGPAERRTTPFLERVAADGISFSRARSPSNWTLPSHASLFTGLSPSEHGCHFEHRFLPGEAQTLAEVLQNRGYVTAAFSGNVNVSRAFHLDQGFDHFYESWTDEEVQAGAHSGDVLCQRVKEWVGDRPAGPVFLFLNLMDAHLPYRPAAGFETRFGTPGEGVDRKFLASLDRPDFLDRVLAGEVAIDERARDDLALRYDNAIRGLDDRLERLCASLERLGLLEDAVLIVTSDHGENLGDHGLVDHQVSLHESVLRVPLILRGPGVPALGLVDRPVLTSDLFAWIQDLARQGFKVPEGNARWPLRSEMLRPIEVLARLEAAPIDPSVVADLGRRKTAALSPDGRFKLLRTGSTEDRLWALPAEGVGEGDEITDQREELERLASALDGSLSRRQILRERFDPEQDDTGLSPEERARLTELGYLSSGFPTGASVHAQEHLNRGNRWYRIEDLKNALAEYRSAVRLRPGFADALFNLALVTDQLEPARAREQWQAYLDAALRSEDQDPESIQHAYQRLEELR